MTALKSKKQNRNTLLLMITFTLLSSLMISCTKRPDYVLSRSVMQNLLYDLHKTDGVLHVLKVPGKNLEERQLYYQSILETYNTNQAQFDSSIIWYTAYPKKFEKIYLVVLQRIEDDLAQFKISDTPKGIPCPDEEYWQSLGNTPITDFPQEKQTALRIILRETDTKNTQPNHQEIVYPILQKKTAISTTIPHYILPSEKVKKVFSVSPQENK